MIVEDVATRTKSRRPSPNDVQMLRLIGIDPIEKHAEHAHEAEQSEQKRRDDNVRLDGCNGGSE
jgi:hypothetical protein